MHKAAFWVPAYQRDLSTNAKALLRLCQREPNPILIADFMRVYQKRMTPLAFIDKWQHLFSPPTQAKMREMRTRIDIDARKRAMLFVARLKYRVRCGDPPASSSQRDEDHCERAPTSRRRRAGATTAYLTDAYVDDPHRAFVRSLRG